MQVLLCTHSAEILSTSFDRDDCSIHHLRSHKDATKVYKRDSREVVEALRRLGTTAAESLFLRGNILVEGEHDAAIIEDGFYEQVLGYKIASLGGRREIEKEILVLQEGEKKKELDKLNCFIFDLDRAPARATSSELVRILQWEFDQAQWNKEFVLSCTRKREELVDRCTDDWIKLCDGKRLIDDIYREYTPRASKFEFKRRLIKRMKAEQTEEWTLVRTKIADALRV